MKKTYANGSRDGFKATWYESGQHKFRTNFVAGDLAGLIVEWDQDGTVIFEAPADLQEATLGDGNPYCFGTPKGRDDWRPQKYQMTRTLASDLGMVLGRTYDPRHDMNKWHCFLLDACSGGRGRSREGLCFKWAESAEGEAIPWVE